MKNLKIKRNPTFQRLFCSLKGLLLASGHGTFQRLKGLLKDLSSILGQPTLPRYQIRRTFQRLCCSLKGLLLASGHGTFQRLKEPLKGLLFPIIFQFAFAQTNDFSEGHSTNYGCIDIHECLLNFYKQ